MGWLDRVWRVCNLWPKPNQTFYKKKKKFVTQPNPSSPKNQPNPAGGLGRVGFGGFFAHPY